MRKGEPRGYTSNQSSYITDRSSSNNNSNLNETPNVSDSMSSSRADAHHEVRVANGVDDATYATWCVVAQEPHRYASCPPLHRSETHMAGWEWSGVASAHTPPLTSPLSVRRASQQGYATAPRAAMPRQAVPQESVPWVRPTTTSPQPAPAPAPAAAPPPPTGMRSVSRYSPTDSLQPPVAVPAPPPPAPPREAVHPPKGVERDAAPPPPSAPRHSSSGLSFTECYEPLISYKDNRAFTLNFRKKEASGYFRVCADLALRPKRLGNDGEVAVHPSLMWEDPDGAGPPGTPAPLQSKGEPKRHGSTAVLTPPLSPQSASSAGAHSTEQPVRAGDDLSHEGTGEPAPSDPFERLVEAYQYNPYFYDPYGGIPRREDSALAAAAAPPYMGLFLSPRAAACGACQPPPPKTKGPIGAEGDESDDDDDQQHKSATPNASFSTVHVVADAATWRGHVLLQPEASEMMKDLQHSCEVRPTYMSFTDVVLSPQSLGSESPPVNLNNVKKWSRRALQIFTTAGEGKEGPADKPDSE